ncbi:MAG: GNAT family N-acetyltransferase [Treponema sp.]|jgi:ribosomal protein S18 acetylase RimI-like enzyme|nr:GNAT family N-acetyltransferase [Treponema sp.]
MKIEAYSQVFEDQVVRLWSRTLFADPLTAGKFRRQALFDDNFDPALCDLALEDGLVRGFILATKRKFPYLERGLEPQRGWINVLFVDKEVQRRGIGSQLLEGAEQKLAGLGAEQLTYGAYSPSYFFPGVDRETYPAARGFFEKHGYRAGEKAYSMKKDLQGYVIPETTLAKKAELEKAGYRFIKFDYRYALDLLEFTRAEFGGGWKRNALISMQNNTAEDCILLVLDRDGKVAAYCMRMIDGNPQRFGPIGTAAAERNSGIGGVLFDIMQFEMTRRGLCQLFFLSTDEPGRRFYERHGLTVFRTFTDYRKELKQ